MAGVMTPAGTPSNPWGRGVVAGAGFGGGPLRQGWASSGDGRTRRTVRGVPGGRGCQPVGGPHRGTEVQAVPAGHAQMRVLETSLWLLCSEGRQEAQLEARDPLGAGVSPGRAKKGEGCQTESGDPSPNARPSGVQLQVCGAGRAGGTEVHVRAQGRPCFKGGSWGGGRGLLEGQWVGGGRRAPVFPFSPGPKGAYWPPWSQSPALEKARGTASVPPGVTGDAKQCQAGVARPRRGAAPGGACPVAGDGACRSSLCPPWVGPGHGPWLGGGEGRPLPGADCSSACSAVQGGLRLRPRSPGHCQVLPAVSI